MIDKQDLTPRRLLAIWWAITWRSVIVILGGSVAAGFALGLVFGLVGLNGYIQSVGFVLGAIIGFIGGLWCLREGLTRRYKGFELSIKTLPEGHF